MLRLEEKAAITETRPMHSSFSLKPPFGVVPGHQEPGKQLPSSMPTWLRQFSLVHAELSQLDASIPSVPAPWREIWLVFISVPAPWREI